VLHSIRRSKIILSSSVNRVGDHLLHFWRNNDDPNQPWNGPTIFGTSAGRINAVSLIQSNFYIKGNFEVVAIANSQLVHFWRNNDDPNQPWNGPFLIPNSAGVRVNLS
jgi:hypothetical protein